MWNIIQFATTTKRTQFFCWFWVKEFKLLNILQTQKNRLINGFSSPPIPPENPEDHISFGFVRFDLRDYACGKYIIGKFRSHVWKINQEKLIITDNLQQQRTKSFFFYSESRILPNKWFFQYSNSSIESWAHSFFYLGDLWGFWDLGNLRDPGDFGYLEDCWYCGNCWNLKDSWDNFVWVCECEWVSEWQQSLREIFLAS